jgi:hypothetical protein
MEITEAQREAIRKRLGKMNENQMAYILGYILRGNEDVISEALASAERLYPLR